MARQPQPPVPAQRRDPDENLTVAQVCTELKIARSTLYDWFAKNRGPKRRRLPNGELRIVRRDFDEWLESCLVA